MSAARTRIGVVGCGYVFDHYMATLAAHPALEIASVWDIDAVRLEQATSYYRLPAAASYEALLADETVALIVNLTSIEAHAGVIRQALEAGKHVYSEKPLTTTLREARALFALAAERGLQLTAAPCNQFADNVQTMWRAVADGAVGRPLIAYAEFDDNPVYLMRPEGWRSRSGAPWPYLHEYEAGCTWEHAGYHFVWLCALFGPVRAVTAFSKVIVPDKTDRPLQPDNTPDFSVAVLDFVNGQTARVTCSIAVPQDHRMRITGNEGEVWTDTYRHYRSPVFLERFTALSLNARKSRTLRRHAWLGGLAGIGGRRLPLVEFPWSDAIKRGSQRGRLAPHKWLIAAAKRREVGAQDKLLGVALAAQAIREGAPPPVSPEFVLHITELTLATQGAGADGGSYAMTTRFEPVKPLPGAIKASDWRRFVDKSWLARIAEKMIDRLHRH